MWYLQIDTLGIMLGFSVLFVLAGNGPAHAMWQADGMAPVSTTYEKKL